MTKQKPQNKIGLRIREIRLKSGLTQEELAASMGKTRPVIQRLETGQVNPSIFFLREIAEGLKIHLEELLKGF